MTLSVAFAGRRGGFALEVAFEAPGQQVTALFGPSGTGKTSVLRAIAGLDRFAGHCRLDDETWQDETTFLPPHRRPVGYVFQEASLFPHLTVRQNLEFGLKRAEPGTRVIGFDDAVGLLGLGPLLTRLSAALSGGERQRVALGRALLSQPRLLLLDEPMSALDRAAKAEIMPYFEALGRAVALPVLLVTHDIEEVERLATHMVVLRTGKVVAAGPLNDLLVGDAAGLRETREAAAVLSGAVVGYDAADGLSEIAVDGRQLLVAGRAGVSGAAVRLRVAARDVSLALEPPSGTTILNALAATIVSIETAEPGEVLVTLRLDRDVMLARITARSVRLLGLAPGQPVFAQVKTVSLVASEEPRV